MAFYLSPGVYVREIDLTTIIPSVSTSIGAFAGQFVWGPASTLVLLSNEQELLKVYGKPDNNTFKSWFTVANFLGYGNAIQVVRAINPNTAKNATANSTGILIENRTQYELNFLGLPPASERLGMFCARYPGEIGNSLKVSLFAGNTYTHSVTRIVVTSGGSGYSNGYVSFTSTGGSLGPQANAYVWANNGTGTIDALNLTANGLYRGVITADLSGLGGVGATIVLSANDTVYETYTDWGSNETRPYYEEFDGPPGTSLYAAKNKAANDELHIIVVDENGLFTGVANTVLEKFSFLSKGIDAKNDDGSSNYYVNVINDKSRYIYILNHATNSSNANVKSITITATGNNYSNGQIVLTGATTGTGFDGYVNCNSHNCIVSVTVTANGYGYSWDDLITVDASSLILNTDPFAIESMANAEFVVNLTQHVKDIENWGLISNNRTFTQSQSIYTTPLKNGNDGLPDLGHIEMAYDKFKNAEEVDISLVMTGGHSQIVSEYVIENIANYRKDCVAFISPEFSDVVDNAGYEVEDIIDYRNKFNSTSYSVLDNNWKYQFDKYNNVYRWVPLNGDIAGLCARTDEDRDPWYSPAGLNRGFIKNVVRLAWNADKTDRDALYPMNINPVVSFPGEGVVLFGDKTMQYKPSAFDRINVRRLFIVLEKAIARAARYSLFEFNDEFTRAQFVALVEPFLRDVQGRRGIYDFRVVCDTTNNTPEVIDRNEFIGDIYIKPARSINFIQLNFIAVRTGVAFEEVVGKWG